MVICIVGLLINGYIKNKQKNLTLIGYSKYSEEWQQMESGAEAAAERFGYNLESIACDSKKDTQTQIELINKAVENEADAILIFPTDIQGLESVLKLARKNNIKIIIQNELDYRDVYPCVGTDKYAAGETLARTLVSDSVGEQKIVCMKSENNADNEIYNGFVNYISAFQRIKIVDESNIIQDKNLASSTARSILEENQNIDYIVCFHNDLTLGVATALKKYIHDTMESSSEKKTISVLGFGHTLDNIGLLEEGYIDYMVFENYYAIGYMSVKDLFIQDSNCEYVDFLMISKDNLYDEKTQKIIFPIK